MYYRLIRGPFRARTRSGDRDCPAISFAKLGVLSIPRWIDTRSGPRYEGRLSASAGDAGRFRVNNGNGVLPAILLTLRVE